MTDIIHLLSVNVMVLFHYLGTTIEELKSHSVTYLSNSHPQYLHRYHSGPHIFGNWSHHIHCPNLHHTLHIVDEAKYHKKPQKATNSQKNPQNITKNTNEKLMNQISDQIEKVNF